MRDTAQPRSALSALEGHAGTPAHTPTHTPSTTRRMSLLAGIAVLGLGLCPLTARAGGPMAATAVPLPWVDDPAGPHHEGRGAASAVSPAPSSPWPDAGPPPQAAAPPVPPAPYPLAAEKAACLYRFLSYVEFPGRPAPAPDAPWILGVLGADEVYEALGPVLQGHLIRHRPVQRHRLMDDDAPAGVHLLFAGGDVDLARHPLIRQARSAHVPIVSDTPDGLAHGAVFNFVAQPGRLRFEASMAAAQQAHLRVSARLLAMAERVQGPRWR